MDSIYRRLKNAYETGGINEVSRKLYWKIVYKRNAKKIRKNVSKAKEEFGLTKVANRSYFVVVSLTTYPKRFPYIDLCLKSLILQDDKPDRIIVYLGSDSVGVELPENMSKFKQYGVEFRYDENEDLRSHKKYFYAMKEYPEAVVVTADDDIIYPGNWLHSLLMSYEMHPDCVSARRVHLMTRKEDGKLKEYNHWIDQYRKKLEPSMELIATGNSGVLYPPHCISDQAFVIEDIKKYCYEADDIWLKCMALLRGTKCVWVANDEVDLPEVGGGDETALSRTNVVENRNDIFLRRLMKHYNITEDMFFG